jgi:NAD-dependent SIR2 family protein deacetylase
MSEYKVDDSGFVLGPDDERKPPDSHPIVGEARTPAGVPKDRCPHCGKFFPPGALRPHIQEFHTHKCSVCGELVEEGQGAGHFRRCYRVLCRICGEPVLFGQMTGHLNTSHLVTCEICGALMIVDKLEKHRRKAHRAAHSGVV